MELSRKSCRLCLTETDFNISLKSNYCKRSNMIDKILVCLKIVIEESDCMNTICYKCANNVEKYYDFITHIKKSQTKLGGCEYDHRGSMLGEESGANVNRRRVTSYVREQVIDADVTFSFLDTEEKKDVKPSSPFFSYFSPPNVLVKPSFENWTTPNNVKQEKKNGLKRSCHEGSRQHSRDLFESQSQDFGEVDFGSVDWRLAPDDNMIKRVRDKCFGRSDY